MARHTVIVVGGGLAGAAAATVLAERGVAVTLVEREAFLGGRAGAWTDTTKDGTTFEMERGFHGFFRQYHNVRALIRRVDPSLDCLTELTDYPLLGPDGSSQSFARLPKTAPLNIIELIRRSPSIRFRDLASADLKRAGAMLSFDPVRTYEALDHTTAREFLDGLGFPPKARQLLFDVFAHSFFNPEDRYSAAELLAMFHYYFTRNPEGLVFDVMNEPFSVSLWKPLERYLQKLGVEVRLGTSARSVAREGSAWVVDVDRGGETSRLHGDALVLATHVPALKSLVQASPSLAAMADGVASLDVTLPFAVLRLWLDRPCAAGRAPFAGTAGFGILDNISLYELFEGESRRWAKATGGSIVELHAYAVPDGMTEASAREELIAQLYAAYPETRSARILEERYLFRQDCPAFAPGSHAKRPGVETTIAGVVLAGDFVKLPFPSALMERATSAGFMAANALLKSRGLTAEPVRHGPTKGVLPAFMAR